VGSLYNLVDEPRHNHRVPTTGGVLGEECGRILKDFFAVLRQQRTP
jgi:tRNA(adenine34) deaminase